MAYYENRGQRFFDYLNNFRFHVLDISFQTPVVFNVSFGFNYCTAPEISVETKEVKSGTFEYSNYVPVGASVAPIELRQGARLLNSDFYDWISRTVRGENSPSGENSPRRNLMLIQYSDMSAHTGRTGDGSAVNGTGDFGNYVFSLNDLISRVPARAWMLMECIPVRYKAGSDFDALGNEISIAELTIQPQFIQEFNLGI